MTAAEISSQCATLIFRTLAATNAEVAVLHTGDKPYLVGPNGLRDLGTRPLTLAALEGLGQTLLSASALDLLADSGATSYQTPRREELPAERFTVVAGRWDDDFWIEIRRHRTAPADAIPAEFLAPEQVIRADDLAFPLSHELWAN